METGKRGAPRQLPSDFADQWAAHSGHFNRLRKHYSVGHPTMQRWVEESGLRANLPKGFRHYGAETLPPEGFADKAPRMTLAALIAEYGSVKRVKRWLRMLAIQPSREGIQYRQPVPHDFAERCAEMTITELRLHYGGGDGKMQRWIRETGCAPKRYEPAEFVRQPARRSKHGYSAGSAYRVVYDQRVGTRTEFDDAADTLRRYGPVYRCTETGKPEPKGAFWRVGNVVCTDDELLARAARYERKAA